MIKFLIKYRIYIIEFVAIAVLLYTCMHRQPKSDDLNNSYSFDSTIGGTEAITSSKMLEFAFIDGGPPAGYCAIDNGELRVKIYEHSLKCVDNFITDDNGRVIKSNPRIILRNIDRNLNDRLMNKDYELKVSIGLINSKSGVKSFHSFSSVA